MCRSALRRLVEATADSAMHPFIDSFSASRLNPLLFFLPFLSFSFLAFLDEVGKDKLGGVGVLLDDATGEDVET